jgi:arsenate reductase
MARKLALVLILVWGSLPMTVQSTEPASRLDKYIAARTVEFRDIPPERREKLFEITSFVRSQANAGQPIRLTFVCTHNSRRSQMAQVWAALAATHYRVSGVESYSGGTERTAFNPRAVAALERSGVPIKQQKSVPHAENPRYDVQLGPEPPPLVCFSKVYHERPNPTAQFAAVMTCAQADKNCPNVVGATTRIALPYDDPKVADGTSKEAEIYDDRCAQIAREMLYAFSGVAGNR